jgi:beta-N-acetylhexosaminidase
MTTRPRTKNQPAPEQPVQRSHTVLGFAFLLNLAIPRGPAAAQQTAGFGPNASLTAVDSTFVSRLLDSLPVRARVAQLVMPWIPGNYAAFDDSAFAVMQGWVDSLQVGGILVSIGSPLDVAMKLNRLQQRSTLPLLIGADLESGASFRLNGATPFPSNMGVAAAGSEQDAYDIGRITALEGLAVGIHLTFSPVADINSNPANPIINTRSFGESAALVSGMVAAAVRGIQDNGMLATAKHFPGHGDTQTDSHIAIPLITAGWPRLDSLELGPFRAAINAGAAFVMSAHVAMPAIGTERTRPATMDPRILTGILRDSLHFQGMVVTDALDMGAIVSTYGAGEAALQAFIAGADLVLQPADPKLAIDALTQAVETGRVSFERLDRSVRRLLYLKLRMGLFARRTVPLESIPDVVGSARFLETARSIAQRSVTLVTDATGTVDSLRARPRDIALVTYGEENAGTVGNAMLKQLRAAGHTVTLFRLWPASGPESLDSAEALSRRDRYTVFAVSVKANAWKGSIGLPAEVARLIDETSRKRRAVLVSLGSPYIGLQVPHLRAFLLAWSANSVTEWAAARALSGQAPIEGRLPVSMPPAFPLGSGLHRGVRSQQ